jgi:hypothetical protein
VRENREAAEIRGGRGKRERLENGNSYGGGFLARCGIRNIRGKDNLTSQIISKFLDSPTIKAYSSPSNF